MTEVEFKQKCKQEKIHSYCYITEKIFLNKPNILGCNKIDDEFIIYFTNSKGIVNEICTLNDENYVFNFLYNLLVYRNELTIGENSSKQKTKTIKM